MSKIVEVTLPKLGESIVGATVVQWLKAVGDRIKLDEPLLEVSTDKVNSEIPSPVSGILKEIIAQQDEEIAVGMPLARIEIQESLEQATFTAPTIAVKTSFCGQKGDKEEIFSPAVLRLAQLEGISIETLRKIEGKGEGGRITKKDVENFIAARSAIKTQPACSKIASPQIVEDRIQMTGMRKTIADNIVRSFYEAPHASLVIDADVTEVMQLLNREKERFREAHGLKLTITAFLIRALTKAIQNFPLLNSSLEEQTIVMKRNVNVGIAVNVEKGLIVPVIKNCQERNLISIAKAVSDLSARARESKLSPDEVADGSVTLTNFGMTGALIGVPIIRFPEVAIIGAGTIQKRVVVKEDDSFAVRQMMYLTLTFDHRVIDGIYGCEFLAFFKNHLETVSIGL